MRGGVRPQGRLSKRVQVRLARFVAVPAAVLLGVAVGTGPAQPPLAAPGVAPGEAMAWGSDPAGQLGNGSPNASASSPIAVSLPAGTPVLAIAPGEGHALALTPQGTVLAWGADEYGQAGTVAAASACVCIPTPTAVALPPRTRVVAVAAGRQHSLALTSTGTVLAWGRNDAGQLGTGTVTSGGCACIPVPSPVALPVGTRVVAIAAGSGFSLALTSTGTVLAWGDAGRGELGNGNTAGLASCTCVPTPGPVVLPPHTEVTAIAAGGNHAMALTAAGGILDWGDNAAGELGNGSISVATLCGCVPTPSAAKLPAGARVTSIAAGGFHDLALTSAGAVLAWGADDVGELGASSVPSGPPCYCRASPVQVSLPPGTPVRAIAGGFLHSMALTSSGNVLAWGDDSVGQLGDGAGGPGHYSSHPVPVCAPGSVGSPCAAAVNGVSGIAASRYASFAVGGQPTTLSVTPSVNPAVFGQPVSLLATALPVSGGTRVPGGSVTFWDGAVALGTALLDQKSPDQAGLVVPSLAVGSHHITAVYAGDGTFVDSVSAGPVLQVSPAGTTTTLASTANPSRDATPVTFTVRVAPQAPGTGTPTGSITLSDGSTTLGTAPLVQGLASLTATLVGPGVHTIAAAYGGDADFTGSTSSPLAQMVGDPRPTRASGAGYRLVAGDGGVFSFGASFLGSLARMGIGWPVTGMDGTPDGGGYWVVASDGGVVGYGDARYLGSTAGMPLNRAVVGIVATPDGRGYWLVASDGGVFCFGTAPFLGSLAALNIGQPVVGMAATPDGGGYWLVTGDGGVFTFGDAPYLGSVSWMPLNQPVVGMAATADGRGYWLVAADGGVFAFGDAPFLGSTGGLSLSQPVVGMAAAADGRGYWLAATDGGVFAFGNAPFLGSTRGMRLNQPVVGIAAG